MLKEVSATFGARPTPQSVEHPSAADAWMIAEAKIIANLSKWTIADPGLKAWNGYLRDPKLLVGRPSPSPSLSGPSSAAAHGTMFFDTIVCDFTQRGAILC